MVFITVKRVEQIQKYNPYLKLNFNNVWGGGDCGVGLGTDKGRKCSQERKGREILTLETRNLRPSGRRKHDLRYFSGNLTLKS